MKIYTIGLVLLFFCINACKEKCECTLIDEMPSFDQLESINGVMEISMKNCVEPSVTEEKEFIIQDDSTYQSLLAGPEDNPNFPNCNDYSLPTIDFTSKTLIGKYTSKWCNETYDGKFVDNGSGNYTYYVKVTSNAGCVHTNCMTLSMNWMTIPKLSDSDNVVFKVVYKYNECYEK